MTEPATLSARELASAAPELIRAARSLYYNRRILPQVTERIDRAEGVLGSFLALNDLERFGVSVYEVRLEDGVVSVERAAASGAEQLRFKSVRESSADYASDAVILAARYERKDQAAVNYMAIQETIRHGPWDISVFRFLLNGVSHVALIGPTIEPDLAAQLRRLLSPGEPVELPEVAIAWMWMRRQELTADGSSWEERHYGE